MGLKRAAESTRGFFERDELEVGSPSAEPDLALFGEAVSRKIKEIAGDKPFAARFGSDIRRASRTVEVGGATIEVALDQGFLFAGEQRAPVYEIELELKSGEPTALIDLGLSLIDALDVKLCVRSKAERAKQLMSAEAPEPARAQPPELDPDTPLNEAIGVLLRNCLSQFLGNLPALELGDAGRGGSPDARFHPQASVRSRLVQSPLSLRRVRRLAGRGAADRRRPGGGARLGRVRRHGSRRPSLALS